MLVFHLDENFILVLNISNLEKKKKKRLKKNRFFGFFGNLVCICRGMLKLLDVLLQLDHLKNVKASIPNDFSWYKR